MQVKEEYTPVLMAADSTLVRDTLSMGGFLAKTSGTLTVAYTGGATVLDAIPVTAGIYTPMPFSFGRNRELSMTFTLAGGASGTLAV